MNVKKWMMILIVGSLALNLVSCGLPAALGRSASRLGNAVGGTADKIMTNGF